MATTPSMCPHEFGDNRLRDERQVRDIVHLDAPEALMRVVARTNQQSTSPNGFQLSIYGSIDMPTICRDNSCIRGR
ncbi:hypothetical protein BD309DRAFT_991315 [Dichomitus squalens]|nr:hypothetical protein BD309DRAFT_991315 [Dichomitus squalens]